MYTVRGAFARRFWYSAALVFFYNGFLLVWLLLKPGSHNLFVLGDDVGQTGGWLLAALLCFGGIEWRAWRTKSRAYSITGRQPLSSERWVPLLFGIGCFSETCGQAIYTYYEQVLHQLAPLPSWADAFFLGGYPFLMLGVLCLAGRPLSTLTRSRIFIDGLMVMTAAITFSWYFILGPTLLQGGGTLLAKLVGTAYPFFDLIMIFCVLILAARSNSMNKSLTVTIRLLSLALVVIVITDSLYDYQTLQNVYATGTMIDLGWPLGYMLIGLAVQALRGGRSTRSQQTIRIEAESSCERAGGKASDAHPAWWRTVLPYLLVPPALLLAIYVNGTGPLERGVYMGGTMLVGLVVLRQILAFRETISNNQELRKTQKTLQVRNLMLNEVNRRLESMATTDPLTGLSNHRTLLEQLHKEFERAARYHHPFAIFFFDGDRFKRVNDMYGHTVGDVVLRELGERTQVSLRVTDILGRYGGEEFMVILPETNCEGALVIAERMRAAVAAHPFALEQVEGGIALTISIGIAIFPLDALSSNELLEKADQAMYWAKRLGRNQIRTTAEALKASQDAGLAATAHSLERGDESRLSALSKEPVLQADQLSIVYSLMWLYELRDHRMSMHAYQVSDLATAIAQELELGQETIYTVATAALLHDIGKLAIPDTLLYKQDKLTEQEWTLMKKHPEHSAQILEINPGLHDLLPAIRHHHERWDGAGYPDQLAGENIPLEARIIAVAEALHTMTVDTPYRKSRTLAAAIAELQRCAGTQFDPAIVAATCTVLQRQQKETEMQEKTGVLSR